MTALAARLRDADCVAGDVSGAGGESSRAKPPGDRMVKQRVEMSPGVQCCGTRLTWGPEGTLCQSGRSDTSLTLNGISRKGAPGWLGWLSAPLTSAQVTISRFMSSSPALGSVPTAQSLEPASDSVSPSLSAPALLALCLSPSQK